MKESTKALTTWRLTPSASTSYSGSVKATTWPGPDWLHLSLPPGFTRPLSAEHDQVAVEALFDLLDKFLTEMGRHSARSRAAVHREHLLWLQDQSWYNLDRVRFGAAPTGDLVDVTEAAAILTVTPTELLDQVYSGAISGGRVGTRLLLRRDRIEAYPGRA